MLKERIGQGSEISMQDIIDALCEGYAMHEILCDDAGVPVNYRLLEVNNAFEQITGLSRREIVGKTVKEVFPEIDSFWIDTYGRVALTGEPTVFENYAHMLDKHFRVSVFTPRIGRFITLFTDISEFKRSEEIMKKHQLLFERAQDAVLYVGDDGRLVDANESVRRLYGYSYEELLGLGIHDIRHPSTRPQFEEQMRQADDEGIIFESIHIRKDGSVFPVEVSSKGSLIGGEKVRIHIIRDITGRKMTEEKILNLANHDSLTGLPNRAFLMKELDRVLEMADHGRYKLAVMLFDIDKFKQINDTYGHQAGDLVLKTVADRVRSVIRNSDMAGRLGGDEFLVLQPMIQSRVDVRGLAERIFQSLKAPVLVGEQSLDVQISMGIGIFPENAADGESLIKCADISMYKAKKESGNQYCFYSM